MGQAQAAHAAALCLNFEKKKRHQKIQEIGYFKTIW